MFRKVPVIVDLSHRFIARCDYLSNETWRGPRRRYLWPMYGLALRITRGGSR